MLSDRIYFFKSIFLIMLFCSLLLINAESSIKRIKEDTEHFVAFIAVHTFMFAVTAILIARIPYVANELHEVVEGTVVSMQWSGKNWNKTIAKYYRGNGEVEYYDIVLNDGEKNEKYKSVCVKDPINEGDKIQVHIYKGVVPSRVITKINGETTKYYTYGYRYSQKEKVITLLLVVFQGLAHITIATYEYYKLKKKAKGWHRAAVISMVVYLSSFIISKKYPSHSNILGFSMVISLGIYVISVIRIYWKSVGEDENPKVSDAEKQEAPQILNVEERRTGSEDENREVSQIQEPQITNEEISEPKGIEPENIEKGYPICKFTPVSNTFSQKYCTYHYEVERKEWFQMTVTISGLFIGFGSIIAYALEEKEELVVKVGIFLWILVVGWYCWREKSKCKKFKQAVKDSRPCEICEVKMALGEEHKYIYSNGQEKIVWMEWDMEGKIKDGQPAVIVYIPLADEFYTDKPETIEMIKEKY